MQIIYIKSPDVRIIDLEYYAYNIGLNMRIIIDLKLRHQFP